MAQESLPEPIRIGKHTRVPSNMLFMWLDTHEHDYERLKTHFCMEISGSPDDWLFFRDKDECYRYIRDNDARKIVLISSGRLGGDIIHDLHTLSHLHSIYIYCNNTEKYQPWMDVFRKIRGIFNNPVQLFDKLCDNLDEEVFRCQLTKYNSCDSITKPKIMPLKLPCLFKNEIKSFCQPTICWCPWQTNNFTESLPAKGQGTIEIWQRDSIPFELYLTNQENPNEKSVNSYAIVLKVNHTEVQLGVVCGRNGHTFSILDSTAEVHEVQQMSDNNWYCYWLTFYGDRRIVQYGMGEIQPKFHILSAHLEEYDKTFIENILFVHLKLNVERTNRIMEHVKDNTRIYIGSEPIAFDPPLLVICPGEISPTHPANASGVFAHMFKNPCRYLYRQVYDFSLRDDNFPNFIESIERSIASPQGWCYQKLQEKANLFGKHKGKASYLCIKLDYIENVKVMNSCVLKIWPPGHYSPVHNYRNAYGFTRILYGKLLIKYFRNLSLNAQQNSLFEQLFEENQVTWMIPKLNQTCQMKNPDTLRSSCITIHSYQYETDSQELCERFDYITNDGHRIDQYDCGSDINFIAFKETLKNELVTMWYVQSSRIRNTNKLRSNSKLLNAKIILK